jgi:hypothetical protein
VIAFDEFCFLKSKSTIKKFLKKSGRPRLCIGTPGKTRWYQKLDFDARFEFC